MLNFSFDATTGIIRSLLIPGIINCWDSPASICPTLEEEETLYSEHVVKTLTSKSEAYII